MSPSRPSFSPRWACKLICRDVKNWFRSVKAGRQFPQQLPQQQLVEETVTRELECPPSPTPTEVFELEQIETPPPANTMYKFIISSLKEIFPSCSSIPDREERHRFRGAWLIFHMAASVCPSNPIYDIFREEPLDEATICYEMFKSCFSLSGSAASNASDQPVSAQPVSALPAAPFSNIFNGKARIDSATGEVPLLTSAEQGRTVAQWWLAILEGVTDKRKTVTVAEELIHHVWVDDSPEVVIKKLGDPCDGYAKQDQLRISMRDMLFPTYRQLSKPRTGKALWGET